MSEADELPDLDPCLMLRLRLRAHAVSRAYSDRPEGLPDEAILPSLSHEFAGGAKFAQVRLAVGSNALFLQADVQGKQQLPWCRDSRLEDSDGLHVWLDTRHSREVQRATQYCHRFGLLPMGRGPKADLPYFGWAAINRARGNPPQPADSLLAIRSRVADGRYRVVAAIHFDALHGLDIRDFPTIGFYFAILDRELGWQSLSVQPDSAAMENPSLWAELALA